MLAFLSLFVLSCASLSAGFRPWDYPDAHPRTQVWLPGRTLINGLVEEKYTSVRQFLGIPYALPPLGDLRFEAPRANRLPRSVQARTLGRSCTQFSTTVPNIYNLDVPEYNIADINSTGEDCLTLSVWTPKEARRLPVLVFFYGGGWYAGGQNTPYTIPTQWVQRTKDLIVVVPNFRGNIFGFPNARGAKEQNLGLLDQRLAVEWVRDNIKSFGGDPSKITIWGQSSGAEAVDMWNYAWYKDPIVNGLIMDSGTAFTEALLGTAAAPRYSNFSYVARHVGCASSNTDTEELECMKKVDAQKIENFIADLSNGGDAQGVAFGTSADERVVFSNYTDRAVNGKLTNLPAIIGINKDDGVAFAPYNATEPDQTISEFWFVQLFLCPALKTARLRAAAGFPTYRYLYSGNFTNLSPRPWMGAYHGSETPMLFGTYGNYRGPSSKYEIAVSKAMQETWRAFADDPQTALRKQWAQFNEQNDAARVIGGGGPIARDTFGELRAYEEQC